MKYRCNYARLPNLARISMAALSTAPWFPLQLQFNCNSLACISIGFALVKKKRKKKFNSGRILNFRWLWKCDAHKRSALTDIRASAVNIWLAIHIHRFVLDNFHLHRAPIWFITYLYRNYLFRRYIFLPRHLHGAIPISALFHYENKSAIGANINHARIFFHNCKI